jgi:hypothetical protein
MVAELHKPAASAESLEAAMTVHVAEWPEGKKAKEFLQQIDSVGRSPFGAIAKWTDSLNDRESSAFTVLRLNNTLIASLRDFGWIFRGKKILGGPLRAFRTEVPSIAVREFSIFNL